MTRKSAPPSPQEELKKITVWIVLQHANERCRKLYVWKRLL